MSSSLSFLVCKVGMIMHTSGIVMRLHTSKPDQSEAPAAYAESGAADAKKQRQQRIDLVVDPASTAVEASLDGLCAVIMTTDTIYSVSRMF